MYCQKCGEMLEEGINQCPKCQYTTEPYDASKLPKNYGIDYGFTGTILPIITFILGTAVFVCLVGVCVPLVSAGLFPVAAFIPLAVVGAVLSLILVVSPVIGLCMGIKALRDANAVRRQKIKSPIALGFAVSSIFVSTLSILFQLSYAIILFILMIVLNAK